MSKAHEYWIRWKECEIMRNISLTPVSFALFTRLLTFLSYSIGRGVEGFKYRLSPGLGAKERREGAQGNVRAPSSLLRFEECSPNSPRQRLCLFSHSYILINDSKLLEEQMGEMLCCLDGSYVEVD